MTGISTLASGLEICVTDEIQASVLLIISLNGVAKAAIKRAPVYSVHILNGRNNRDFAKRSITNLARCFSSPIINYDNDARPILSLILGIFALKLLHEILFIIIVRQPVNMTLFPDRIITHSTYQLLRAVRVSTSVTIEEASFGSNTTPKFWNDTHRRISLSSRAIPTTMNTVRTVRPNVSY